MCASSEGNASICDLLLNRGAKADIADKVYYIIVIQYFCVNFS